jgi:hypothetical protein
LPKQPPLQLKSTRWCFATPLIRDDYLRFSGTLTY